MGARRWNAFADNDRGKTLKNAARGRAANSGRRLFNMAITRKQALKRIAGLIGERSPAGIEAHRAKLAKPGSGPHVRAELNARFAEIGRLAEHCGDKTGAETLARVAEWRKRTSETPDVDF